MTRVVQRESSDLRSHIIQEDGTLGSLLQARGSFENSGVPLNTSRHKLTYMRSFN